MFRNYLKVALRFLTRQKSYTFINIAGLALGMAATIMILIYVFYEKGYDRCYTGYENIYRLNSKGVIGDNEIDAPISPTHFGRMLVEDFPQVKQSIRLLNTQNRAIKHGKDAYYEDDFVFADSTFFELFDLKFHKGTPETALKKPLTVVITEETAKRYFGEEDPMGESFKLTNHFGMTSGAADTVFFEVTGVVGNFPSQSHFHFDFMASMGSIPLLEGNDNLFALNVYTYLRVAPETDINNLEEQINNYYYQKAAPQLEETMGMNEEQFAKAGNYMTVYLTALKDIHLHSHGNFELEENGKILYVKIFSSIAVLILLLACINFINLSTARSVKRAREVGIRKVVGSTRGNLMQQFIGESFLLAIISFLIAMMFVEFSLPFFERITGQPLEGFYLGKAWFWLSVLAIIFVVGFFSGLYPAIVLSSYKPVDVIRALPPGSSKGFTFRNILVTFQFIITGAILLALVMVKSQLGYIQSKELGFDKEKLMVIERTDPIRNNVKTFMDEVAKLPEVENISLSAGMIGRGNSINGVNYRKNGKLNTKIVSMLSANYEFLNVLGVDIIQGRGFSRDFNDQQSVIINETLAKELGYENVIDENLFFGPVDTANNFRVVGVMRDFHYESLHEPIRPLMLMLNPAYYDGYITLRLREGNHLKSVEKIKGIWNEFASSNPLVYYYFDDDFKHFYKEEERTADLMELFSVLSIIVAALGLFGLVSYSVTTRTREIGIRKTSGAGGMDIIFLIIKDNIKPIFYSLLISFPLAWFFMDKWLQNFAYRIDINPAWFGAVLISLFAVGIMTTIFQASQASRINPAEAVRTE